MKNCSTVAGILGLLAITGVLAWCPNAVIGGENPTPAGNTLVGWGANDLGETDVPDGDFAAIAGGEMYSLAIRADGSLAGWGFNQYGQTDVPAGNDFVAVSAGFAHGLALRADGSLVGWGGQALVPQGSFASIAAGGSHSLAVRDDGSLVGWGGWNLFGESDVPPGNNFVAVAAGYFHGLARRADPEVAPVHQEVDPVLLGLDRVLLGQVHHFEAGDVQLEAAGGALIGPHRAAHHQG